MHSFIVSVAAGAFCLFLIQPLVAKQILPWFGGSASVWAVCVVFYQAALLAGYVYAHALARYLKLRAQALVHASVVAASLLTLPVGLSGIARPAPGSSSPSLEIVWMLFRAIGIPYLVLSATSPLMQAWYASLDPRGRVYRLFGWSNLSCAAALLSFPFLLEPWLPLSRLNLVWSWCYGAAALSILVSALALARGNHGHTAPELDRSSRPSLRSQAKWLCYSALGSVLLLSLTNHLCQSVAPIPFLWTVPLLLYLLTFVAVFEREWYTRRWGMPLAGASVLVMAWAIVYLPPEHMLSAGIPIFAAGCFFTCFFCHGELARGKPAHSHLTYFYIVVAAGGALGSCLVAFVAPLVFRRYAELPVALAVVALLILFTIYGRWWYADLAAACCVVAALAIAYAFVIGTSKPVASGRNFYGALRVEDEAAKGGRPPLRKIVHGIISHGSQFLDPAWRMKPTTYYGPLSGAGVVLRHTKPPRRIGLVGLGAGTLATYGQPGDRFVFYEINPLIADYARRYFTFLSSTAASVDIRIGDGRILLEAEPPQSYDMIVIDAFSGDSIPVHLITREALRLYARHLKPGGVLAFHLSNLHLELQPVVRAIAHSEGLLSVPVLDPGLEAEGISTCSWALVGTRESLGRFPVNLDSKLRRESRPEPWTDDHSTLLVAID